MIQNKNFRVGLFPDRTRIFPVNKIDGNYDADGLVYESQSKSCRKSLALQYSQWLRISKLQKGGRYTQKTVVQKNAQTCAKNRSSDRTQYGVVRYSAQSIVRKIALELCEKTHKLVRKIAHK